MTDLKLPELPEAVLREAAAVNWPNEGIIDSEPAMQAWRNHLYDTGAEPYFTAAQLTAYATAAVLAERAAGGSCEWWYDDDGTWHGACGVTWHFTDDGPVENNYHFCHGCGKRIAIDATMGDDDEA